MMPLRTLQSNKHHIRQVAELYLQKTDRVSFGPDYGCVFSAEGVGHDEERQFVTLSGSGHMIRGYIKPDGSIDGRAPVQTGKVLSILLELGYQLPPQQLKQAVLYNRFATTGISNLRSK